MIMSAWQFRYHWTPLPRCVLPVLRSNLGIRVAHCALNSSELITSICFLSDAQLVCLQVGDVQKKWGGPNPGDFDCYRRAESIPGNKHPEQPPAQDHGNCPMTTRNTTIATSSEPASDQAADAAAGLAMAACLLAEDKPVRSLLNLALTQPSSFISDVLHGDMLLQSTKALLMSHTAAIL